jgi:DNA processing protein
MADNNGAEAGAFGASCKAGSIGRTAARALPSLAMGLAEGQLIAVRGATTLALMGEESAASLSEAERRDRLRLIRSENVGPITFRKLLDRFGTASAALRALPDLARKGGRRDAVRVCSVAEAEAELAILERHHARLIVLGDSAYPPPLAAIEDAPATISAIGDASLLSRACVAVVGSRNASLSGRRLANDLAFGLGSAGFVVVSGLARGIDTEAHRGALASGTAILASGVDICYPQENAGLYASIAARGALVSEAPPGMAPQARHFPRRNRLISGLSSGVVVVEANLRSGSLITARMALEQGREVFAVPGSPLDPRARGCNDLLRQGAALTETVADVLAVLPPPGGSVPIPRHSIPAKEPAAAPLDDAEPDQDVRRLIAETLSPTPVAVDEIIRTCQLSPAQVSTILLEWELAGQLERHPGNRVSRIA